MCPNAKLNIQYILTAEQFTPLIPLVAPDISRPYYCVRQLWFDSSFRWLFVYSWPLYEKSRRKHDPVVSVAWGDVTLVPGRLWIW